MYTSSPWWSACATRRRGQMVGPEVATLAVGEAIEAWRSGDLCAR